jgi:hypothetical protein
MWRREWQALVDVFPRVDTNSLEGRDTVAAVRSRPKSSARPPSGGPTAEIEQSPKRQDDESSGPSSAEPAPTFPTPHGGTCLDFLYLVYIFSMIVLRSPS